MSFGANMAFLRDQWGFDSGNCIWGLWGNCGDSCESNGDYSGYFDRRLLSSRIRPPTVANSANDSLLLTSSKNTLVITMPSKRASFMAASGPANFAGYRPSDGISGNAQFVLFIDRMYSLFKYLVERTRIFLFQLTVRIHNDPHHEYMFFCL